MTRTTSWLGSREMGGAGCSACYHMLSTASSELSHPILTADCCQLFLSGNYSQKEGCWLRKAVRRVLKKLGIKLPSVQFSSVQLVVSDSLPPHELQHARPPCLSPTPGVHSDSCPSSQWCHPAISSSVIPFSSCPQSLPASEFFSNKSTLHMRWPKYWSFSFSISPSKEHPGLITNC